MNTPCPFCGRLLGGLARYCHWCKRYTDEAEPKKPTPVDALPDTRSEDERKADALKAVELLQWIVIDLEQGYRPHHCPKCQNKIPGGTRTTLGLADWLCLKDGTAAFIEWKDAKGKQSAHQIAFQDACDVAGIPYRVCRTTEEAVAFLEGITQGEAP